MKKGLTELVFILDESGSMAPLVGDTVGGFNGMLEKQKRTEGECFVTTVLFNDTDKIIHDRVALSEIQPLTFDDYVPCGTTALLDAIGNTVQHIAQIHKYARNEDVPEHTMFVITTDGMENASRKYEKADIKRLIEKQKECGWEFVFLGANIDAISTAKSIGITEDRAVDFVPDSKGIAARDDDVNDLICLLRGGKAVGGGWKANTEADFQKRGKKG